MKKVIFILMILCSFLYSQIVTEVRDGTTYTYLLGLGKIKVDSVVVGDGRVFVLKSDGTTVGLMLKSSFADSLTARLAKTTVIEILQDITGGMVTGNTETGITVTYTDGGVGAGVLDFSVPVADYLLKADFGDSLDLYDGFGVTITDLGLINVDTSVISTPYDLSSGYQPLEATLTDIADGTIAENLVNTTNPWADNEIASSTTWNAKYSATDTTSTLATQYDISLKQGLDADLTDLADGSLTASKVAGVADADYGDVTITSGSWAVEDESHAHTTTTLSGIDITDDTNLASELDITLSATVRGTGTFYTTATKDTVIISGALNTDIYIVSPKGATISSNDVLSVEAYAGGLYVYRPAAGTSGLSYNWLRIR